MSVLNDTFTQPIDFLVAAHWTNTGERGVDLPAGAAKIGLGTKLSFVITKISLEGQGVLGSEVLALPKNGWALRVDEVAFPVGAVAHRHTHTGSGWRHLVSGVLRIEAEGHTQTMRAGDSWFEPAHSPVRAVAMQGTGVTRFVRCMAVPLEDVGQSTFHLVSPDDADLPRLQVTHRHLDHVVQVDAG